MNISSIHAGALNSVSSPSDAGNIAKIAEAKQELLSVQLEYRRQGTVNQLRSLRESIGLAGDLTGEQNRLPKPKPGAGDGYYTKTIADMPSFGPDTGGLRTGGGYLVSPQPPMPWTPVRISSMSISGGAHAQTDSSINTDDMAGVARHMAGLTVGVNGLVFVLDAIAIERAKK